MPSRTWFTGYWGASSNGRLQLAYTATFGGGFSATLALEDKDDYRGAVRFNRFINPLIGIAPPSVTTPNRMPAFVANLRLDQGWGTLQVMGAVIRNNAVYTNPVLGTLNTVSKTGWAVAAGLMLKLDALAKGDRVYFHAGYANGALDHILPNYLNGDRSDGRGMGGFMRDDHNVGLHVCTVTGLVCAENNKAWSMGMVFTHYWTPSVRSNFALSYASITPGSVSRAADWYAFGGLGKGNAWAASGNLIWSPTSGFDIGVELHYRRLRQSLAGTAPFITPYGNAFFSPETVGTRRGESTFYTKIRVQRTF